MLQMLLNAGTTINQISDLFSDKWAEILGLISIPTIATALIVSVIKLISSCISKKIASKNIKPLADKVSEAKNALIEGIDSIEKKFNAKLEEYTAVVEAKFNECVANYTKAKQVAFNKLIEGEAEIQETLKEVEQVQAEIVELDKEIQECETVEEIVEIVEPKVEPIIEEIKQEEPAEDNEDYLLR